MTTIDLEQRVRDMLEHSDYLSFVELSRIEGFRGDCECGLLDHNIIYWQHVSAEAIEAIGNLIRDGAAHWYVSSPIVYVADGVFLKLPLAKRARHYKKPHWLPMTLARGPGRPKPR